MDNVPQEGSRVNQSSVKSCNWRDDKALFSFDPRRPGTFFLRQDNFYRLSTWGVSGAASSYWDG